MIPLNNNIMSNKKEQSNKSWVDRFFEVQRKEFLGYELSEEEQKILDGASEDGESEIPEDFVEQILDKSLGQIYKTLEKKNSDEGARIIKFSFPRVPEKKVELEEHYAIAASAKSKDLNLQGMAKAAIMEERPYLDVPLFNDSGKKIDRVRLFEIVNVEMVKLLNVENYNVFVITEEGLKNIEEANVGRLIMIKDLVHLKVIYNEKGIQIILTVK